MSSHRPLALAAAVLAAAPFVAFTAAPVSAATTPVVISHRGYTGTGCTEDTACSFTAAAQHQTDRVEMDVRFTKTGMPVIMHDPTVDRTTTGTGTVASKTQTQFTALHTNDGDSGHPPTLWAALNAAKTGGVGSFVELKTNPTAAEWRAFISKIPSGYRSRIVIHSFLSAAVWAARSYGFPMVRDLSYATAASWTWNYDGESPQYPGITAGGVATLHAHGVKVYPWTVDDPAAWRPLADKGVDGIITNADPHVVKAALAGS